MHLYDPIPLNTNTLNYTIETFFREKPSRKSILDSIGANLKITFCEYLELKYYDQ